MAANLTPARLAGWQGNLVLQNLCQVCFVDSSFELIEKTVDMTCYGQQCTVTRGGGAVGGVIQASGNLIDGNGNKVAGFDGSITVGSLTLPYRSVEVNYLQKIVDTTAYGDEFMVYRGGGASQTTINVSGVLDTTALALFTNTFQQFQDPTSYFGVFVDFDPLLDIEISGNFIAESVKLSTSAESGESSFTMSFKSVDCPDITPACFKSIFPAFGVDTCETFTWTAAAGQTFTGCLIPRSITLKSDVVSGDASFSLDAVTSNTIAGQLF